MSSAPRVAKHRARMKARAELLTLLLQVPGVRALANELVAERNELANVLANDPLLLANALQQRELTGYATLQGAGRVAPTPTTTTTVESSPPLGEKIPTPPKGVLIPSPAPPARERDALIDAWADVFAEGDYRNLSDREFGQILKANVKLRNMAQRTDRTVEDMAQGIRTAARNWPNVKGARPMTIALIVDEWGSLVHGPQTRGRDNGRIHTQYLNESAAVKHAPKLQSREEYRRD